MRVIDKYPSGLFIVAPRSLALRQTSVAERFARDGIPTFNLDTMDEVVEREFRPVIGDSWEGWTRDQRISSAAGRAAGVLALNSGSLSLFAEAKLAFVSANTDARDRRFVEKALYSHVNDDPLYARVVGADYGLITKELVSGQEEWNGV